MPIIIIALILSSIIRSNIQWLFLVNCFVSVIMTLLILQPKKVIQTIPLKKSWFPVIGLSLLSLQFLLVSSLEGKTARETVMDAPQPERYAHDTKVYVRAYYLMNQGIPYHQAIANSYDQDTRTKGNPPDVWGFRLPTVFYFWHFFSFGQPIGIYLLFIITALTIMFISYKTAAVLVPPQYALLAPTLIIPYLIMGSTTPEFVQMEWWGIIPLILCLWGILTKKSPYIILGAAGAVLCRETYVLPIVGFFLSSLISKDIKTIKGICIAGLIVFLLYILHFQAVSQIMPLTPAQIFTGRQHAVTFEFVRQVLAYATQRYLAAPYKIFSLFVLLSSAFALKAFIRRTNQWPIYLVLLLPVCISLLAFIKIGLCCWSDYWGVMIGPLLCLITAITVGLQLPHQKHI